MIKYVFDHFLLVIIWFPFIYFFCSRWIYHWQSAKWPQCCYVEHNKTDCSATTGLASTSRDTCRQNNNGYKWYIYVIYHIPICTHIIKLRTWTTNYKNNTYTRTYINKIHNSRQHTYASIRITASTPIWKRDTHTQKMGRLIQPECVTLKQ